jgi:hypothetical protein
MGIGGKPPPHLTYALDGGLDAVEQREISCPLRESYALYMIRYLTDQLLCICHLIFTLVKYEYMAICNDSHELYTWESFLFSKTYTCEIFPTEIHSARNTSQDYCNDHQYPIERFLTYPHGAQGLRFALTTASTASLLWTLQEHTLPSSTPSQV